MGEAFKGVVGQSFGNSLIPSHIYCLGESLWRRWVDFLMGEWGPRLEIGLLGREVLNVPVWRTCLLWRDVLNVPVWRTCLLVGRQAVFPRAFCAQNPVKTDATYACLSIHDLRKNQREFCLSILRCDSFTMILTSWLNVQHTFLCGEKCLLNNPRWCQHRCGAYANLKWLPPFPLQLSLRGPPEWLFRRGGMADLSALLNRGTELPARGALEEGRLSMWGGARRMNNEHFSSTPENNL